MNKLMLIIGVLMITHSVAMWIGWLLKDIDFEQNYAKIKKYKF